MKAFFVGLAGCVVALVAVALFYSAYFIVTSAVIDHHNIQVLVNRAIQQDQAAKK